MLNPFGSVFSEEIDGSDKKRKISDKYLSDSGEVTSYQNRWLFFFVILVFGLGTLFIRLFHLSVVDGGYYRQLAEGNRIREEKIPASRGIIYDRNGHILARNIPVFKTKSRKVFFEDKPSLEPADITEEVGREYVYRGVFAHVLGYTGEADENDIEKSNSLYQTGDLIGKMGVEKTYDRHLRGQNGKELKEVDAVGKTVRILGKIAPIPGKNLSVTLDLDLQKAASEAMGGKIGAVIVEDPQNGELLVLYSSPSFDPNGFIRDKDVEKMFSDPDKPLYNRAISGEYPPGSTFKIVTAIAALENGVITKDTKIEDTGVLTVGTFSFGNWYFSQYGRKEGILDIIGAIRRSNDIFFYKTGEMVGIERLADWAVRLGIGRTLGIDIPGEADGLMPDENWRKRVMGEGWYLGNTYHVAIGQGDVLTTPLQVNAWTNVIANGGKLCRPHLVKTESGKETSDGVRKHSSEVEGFGEICRDLGIKKETIELIREGMKEACSPASPAGGPGGTGWPLFKFKVQNSKFKIDGIDFLESYESTTSGKPVVEIPVACKTGTAEFGDPKNRTHAWFSVFAPVYNPQISVTVLLEAGGEGSTNAAPIAKKILEQWFSR